ncbi:alpha-2-macroglobulin family protein [Gynurincola endophyticus]|uniref:alpha-2-macroglobulin family protein n=1 Tax=Gynurincola endophyticus TaxID=2479004 RepID=UPI000F8CBAD8|nr:alpha-2-macroglobulin family protein [Gynurincola endophyticus]
MRRLLSLFFLLATVISSTAQQPLTSYSGLTWVYKIHPDAFDDKNKIKQKEIARYLQFVDTTRDFSLFNRQQTKGIYYYSTVAHNYYQYFVESNVYNITDLKVNFLKNSKGILLVIRNKDGQLVKSAEVIASKKLVPFNVENNGYLVEADSEYLRIKYQGEELFYSLKTFSSGYRKKSNRGVKEFWASSKPMYRMGDTLKVKYFNKKMSRFDRVNNPLRVSLSSQGIWKDTVFYVKPYRKSFYEFSFPLASWNFTLDKDITVSVSNRGVYSYHFIPYTQYELKDLLLDYQINKTTIHKEDSLILQVNVKDKNQFLLHDATVYAEVVFSNLRKQSISTKQEAFQKIIWSGELIKESDGRFYLRLAGNDFPGIDANYTISLKATTSNQLTIEEKITLITDHDLGFEVSTVRNDSIVINAVNKEKLSGNYTVTFLNTLYEELASQKLSLQKWVVLPEGTEYLKVSSEEGQVFLLPVSDFLQPQVKIDQQQSITVIDVQSPAPVWYTVTKNNKIIASGYKERANHQYPSGSKDVYLVKIYYLQGNEWKEASYSSSFSPAYKIEIEAPEKATPGQEVNTLLTVKDQNGRPVKDLDITASGVKEQFERTNFYAENSVPAQHKRIKMQQIENINQYQKIKDVKQLKELYDNPLMQLMYTDSAYMYIEDAPSEADQLLFYYIGKDDLIAVLKDREPVHLSVDKNTAVISANMLDRTEKLLVITSKKQFYIHQVSVPKGKRKVFVVNEKGMFNSKTLVSAVNDKIRFTPQYFSLSNGRYRYTTSYLKVEDYYIPLLTGSGNFILSGLQRGYSLYNYRLYNQSFQPNASSSFFIDKGYIYEKNEPERDFTKLGYRKTLPGALREIIYSERDLDSLHIQSLLSFNIKRNRENNFYLDTSNSISPKYILVRYNDTLNIYDRHSVNVQSNSPAVIYYFYSYGKVLIDSIEKKSDYIVRKIDPQLKQANNAERKELYRLLEKTTGFESIRLEYSEDWTSLNYIKLMVLDEQYNPIPFANVKYEGGNASTNANGIATIPLIKIPYVEISALGYNNVKYYWHQKSNIILMNPKSYELDEVVVVGYAAKKNLQGVLTGRVVGVSAKSATIRIRGLSSIERGSAEDEITKMEDADSVTPEINEEPEVSYYVPRMRSSFKDESFWFPDLKTDMNGQVKLKYKLPDDITAWKTQFLVTDGKKHFYTKKLPLRVYLPVFADIEHPKFLTDKDYFQYTTKVRQVEDTGTVNIEQAISINNETVKNSSGRLANILSEKNFASVKNDTAVHIEYMVSIDQKMVDAIEKTIPVFPVGTFIADQEYFTLTKDTGISIANPSANIYLAIQNNYPSILNDRMKYLQDYLYECNEQQASRLIGLLWQKKLYESRQMKFKHDLRIKKIIKQLLSNQNDKGGWSWFGKNPATEWITDHVNIALKMAVENGYEIKPEVFAKVNRQALEWKNDVNADRIIALKILNEAVTESDIRLGYNKRSSYHTLLLSRIFNLEIDSVLSRVTEKETIAYYSSQLNYVLDNSVMTSIELYRYLKSINHRMTPKVMNYLKEIFLSKQYLNTYQLSSLMNVVMPEIITEDTSSEKNRFWVNGQPVKFNEEGYYENQFRSTDAVNVRFEGSSLSYLSFYTKRWDTATVSVNNGYRVTTNWVSATRPGEIVKLKVSVDAERTADYVMLEIPIPAGLDYAEKPAARYGEYYRSYYDHQVVIFYESLAAGKFEIEIPLVARYEGKYYINPAKISQQYFPAFYGATGVKRMEVGEK